MLHSLKIENIALIKDLTIDFKNNLNVLSGETGAGKSIIIDSLNFLLGARADKTLIRTKESEARVVGVFSVDCNSQFVKDFFNKLQMPVEDTVIISRQMNANAKSITKVNSEFVTSSLLKQLTSHLIDVHGQNEHQFLLNNKNQLAIIDNYSQNTISKLKQEYINVLNEVQKVNEQINSFGGSEQERLKQIDLLEYEINEIDNANLSIDEEEELTTKFKKMQNAEKIANSLTLVNNAFEDSVQGGVLHRLATAKTNLNTVEDYDKELQTLSSRLDSTKLELEDIVFELNNFADSLEFNAEEFEKVDDRMDHIKKLKRKYGPQIQDVLDYLQLANKKLYKLQNSKKEIDKLNAIKTQLLQKLLTKANKLSEQRKQNAKDLTKEILSHLKDLGMQDSQLDIVFNTMPTLETIEETATNNGVDKVEFMFSANLGEPVKTLNKIISGGELSRFMLAIKAVVAVSDNIPTMIFDEIDTGIGGKMAQAVSKKLAIISKQHQVIVISHLPQIAAMADHHLFIEKNVKNKTTLTSIKEIKNDVLINEIARMVSGANLTNEAINNAKKLKEECNEFKINL
jgi:DNA repair protein RecN (Recombination protein N)